MGTPSVGDVVIIPFPYSDLSQSKRRPALVLAAVGRGDFLLCQITSKQYDDLYALSLKEGDFLSGGIRLESFICASKLVEVIHYMIEMLSACLKDDTF